jgi:MATE family multidrug resistance protein
MTTELPTVRPTRASTREVLRLAWPLVLTQSAWTLQIVLDRIFLSQWSTEAVGAGISAVMIFWTGLGFFQWTVNYATTFVAQYTGAGQPHRVGAVTGQALWLAVLSGLSFLLLIPAAGPIVSLGGHDADLQRMEAIYFRCLCFSALPILVSAAAGSFFAGRGDTLTVLLLNVIGLVVNAAVAFVLIFGRLGFAPMGIAGAGWATVAGTSASALVGLALLVRPRFVREFGNVVNWKLDRELFGRLLYFGLPQGVGTLLETLAFTLFLIFVGRLGKEDLAATSIACTLNLLCFLPMMGVGQAIEVLVGQRLGENQPRLAERAVWTGLIVSFSFTAVVAAAYVFAPGLLAWPFQTQDDPAGWAEVLSRVVLLLQFVAVYCLFDSLSLVFAFGLRGAGDTRFVMLTGLLVCWPIMVVPTWAAWYFGWGMYWAWTFASAYICILAGVYLWRFLRGRWRNMRVIEQQPQLPELEPGGWREHSPRPADERVYRPSDEVAAHRDAVTPGQSG